MPLKLTAWISTSGYRVWNHSLKALPSVDLLCISATSMGSYFHKKKKDNSIQVFATSLKDIEKALAIKQKGDPKTLLPKEYYKFLSIFSCKAADTLPKRCPGVDLAIQLEKDNKEREKQPPWGLLFHMTREELLVLQKTLLEYLNKDFIRVNKSPVSAPVLFTKKPGGSVTTRPA